MDDANTDMLMLERYVGLLQRIAAEAKVLHQTGLFREVVDLYNMGPYVMLERLGPYPKIFVRK